MQADLVVATEARLPGMFGDILLLCAPENADVTRVADGVMSMLLGHNDNSPIGRVVTMRHANNGSGKVLAATVEFGSGPLAASTLRDVREGTIRGCSPGFMIADAEIMDGDGDEVIHVTRSQIYEISMTPIPRNQRAKVTSLGGDAMTMTVDRMVTLDDNRDDRAMLETAAVRAALKGGTGSQRQRKAMSNYIELFDAKVSGGSSPYTAAAEAAREAKRAA